MNIQQTKNEKVEFYKNNNSNKYNEMITQKQSGVIVSSV